MLNIPSRIMSGEEEWHRNSLSTAQTAQGLLAPSCRAPATDVARHLPVKSTISVAAATVSSSSAASFAPAAAASVVPVLPSDAAAEPSALHVPAAAAGASHCETVRWPFSLCGAPAHVCPPVIPSVSGAAAAADFTSKAAPFSATPAENPPAIRSHPAGSSSSDVPVAIRATACAAEAPFSSSGSVALHLRHPSPGAAVAAASPAAPAVAASPAAPAFAASPAAPPAALASPAAPAMPSPRPVLAADAVFHPAPPAAGSVAAAVQGVVPRSAGSAAAAAASREEDRGGRQQEMPLPATTVSPSVAAKAAGRRSYRIGVQSNADPYYALRCLLQRPQPFAPPEFIPGEDALRRLRDTRVLVVGAGGLGCELLKCLCLSGFKRLTVLDMDVVQISNLHRQFLFREHHVGQFKACVAANCLNSMFSHLGVTVESCVCRLEEKDENFYRQFQLVLSGLDSIEGRRWLNSMIHSLVERDENGEIDVTTCIPLLDGGTEGLKGQARFIFPFATSCFECSLDSFPPQKTYPLCTISETPRLPEHCVEYAMLVQWPKEHPHESFDSETLQHMEWLFSAAQRRAEAFGIHGVTYSLTLGVAKRIIPAIVSTNAIIAAILVEEAVKIATGCLCSTHDFTVAAAAAKEEDAPTAEAVAARALGAKEAAAEAANPSGMCLDEKVLTAADRPSSGVVCSGSPVAVAAAAVTAPASLRPSELTTVAGACAGFITTIAAPSEGDRGSTVTIAAEQAAAAVEATTAAVARGNNEENKQLTSLSAAATDTSEAPEADEEVLSNIQNYIMYMGEAGIYTHTFEYGKKPGCVVCSGKVLTKRIAQPEEETLQDLLDFLAAEPSLRLNKPSITGPRGIVFLQHPPQLRRAYEPNLSKTIRELQHEGLLDEEELVVTDPLLRAALRLRLRFG